MHQLPPEVLTKVCTRAIEADSAALPTLLWKLDRKVSAAALTAAYHTLVVPDDSSIVDSIVKLNQGKRCNSQLDSLCSNLALGALVKVLKIEGAGLKSSVGNSTTQSESKSNLVDADVAQLISTLHLTSLTHLIVPRAPPSSSIVPNLTHLKCKIDSRWTRGDPERWNHIELPQKLVYLSISHLDTECSKSLGRALTNSRVEIGLEEIELDESTCVDDLLLESIAKTCPNLTKLTIHNMCGSKLSEVGLKAVMNSCQLRELNLINVEGDLNSDSGELALILFDLARFSKKTWLSFSNRTLRSLRISYSASKTHHSWVLDHLDSIESVISANNLETLSISRTGSDQTSSSAVVSARPIKTSLFEAIAATPTLKHLSLSLFEISLDMLKTILNNCDLVRQLLMR